MAPIPLLFPPKYSNSSSDMDVVAICRPGYALSIDHAASKGATMHRQVGVHYMKIFYFFSRVKSLFTKFWSSAVRDQKSAKHCAKRIAPSKQRKGLGGCGAKGALLGRNTHANTPTHAHACTPMRFAHPNASTQQHHAAQHCADRHPSPMHPYPYGWETHCPLTHSTLRKHTAQRGTCVAQSIGSLNRVRFYSLR